MKKMNIYMTGVGGQGIGMLSEILVRAVNYAGYKLKAVDTHGLAQRGGIVVSQLRIGDGINSPLIESGDADLVISLERHEALRAMNSMLKNGGTLVWYDTSWQPLSVRTGQDAEVRSDDVSSVALKKNVRNLRVYRDNLPDTRMQNITLLSEIIKNSLISGLELSHCEKAMKELMNEKLFVRNLAVLKD
ncbi:MAG TPA: 2-oxoacid:acceptor oxidoreductase family protein [bacterium]|mgnify:CR=1 FL=1|nr:2-oxoacid:acceptor oxidoreductase family protein [bacterium]HPS29258.1 2-oxoacid:acceptor oxidoreductase family protein [bacterium]